MAQDTSGRDDGGEGGDDRRVAPVEVALLKVRSVRLERVAARPEDFPRDGRPEVCFLGRSYVGKSSLINALVRRPDLARVSKTPGRTRAIHFYLLDERAHLVDLPGFGYARVPEAERRQWRRLVESYFDRRGTLALAVQLVDVRHEPMDLDLQLARMLARQQTPAVVALTKADKLPRGQVAHMLDNAPRALGLAPGTPVVATSSRTGAGLRELAQLVVKALAGAGRGAAGEELA